MDVAGGSGVTAGTDAGAGVGVGVEAAAVGVDDDSCVGETEVGSSISRTAVGDAEGTVVADRVGDPPRTWTGIWTGTSIGIVDGPMDGGWGAAEAHPLIDAVTNQTTEIRTKRMPRRPSQDFPGTASLDCGYDLNMNIEESTPGAEVWQEHHRDSSLRHLSPEAETRYRNRAPRAGVRPTLPQRASCATAEQRLKWLPLKPSGWRR